MVGIVFILFLVTHTLHAEMDEQNGKRSAKNAFVSMRNTWEALKEEAELKKKRKFGLGNTANKDSSKQNTRQLTPVKVSMLEDKVRLASYEPVAYKPGKNLDLTPPQEQLKLRTEVRHHEHIAHQPLKPMYLRVSE